MFGAGETETVVAIRPPLRDQYGDPVPGSGVETPIAGCLFAPGPSAEMLNGATQVDTDGTVYAPVGADIEPTDKLRIRGDVYEVVGRPRRWDSVGLEIVVRLVTG
ncbi:hypothetical protein I0C86_41465 [Plantactinospora sp. S1510]|uniref:Head-to-tail stopper n=1 Tax=Plantactinospora alkalitolerans TaxID=2789879 RepID=A0ABS0HA09_9ACTN|nr:hypothetical protein [Plantactinospora alkalitolerans]MBF9135322.1 hypothetical protein [Plantactinospora alkalitolerans]